MARLQEFYKETVVADLSKQFGYKSVMEVPRITKITLNMGVGEAVADKKVLENAVGDMQKIAGQKPVTTKARKSIAGFKIRDGYPIGCMVTLRGPRMFEFLDRLVTVALPEESPPSVGQYARSVQAPQPGILTVTAVDQDVAMPSQIVRTCTV